MSVFHQSFCFTDFQQIVTKCAKYKIIAQEQQFRGQVIIKGIVLPKNENSVINYSPSCRSKPVRPSLIYRTQIKIFFKKSKICLTLHRQQGYYHVQGPEM